MAVAAGHTDLDGVGDVAIGRQVIYPQIDDTNTFACDCLAHSFERQLLLDLRCPPAVGLDLKNHLAAPSDTVAEAALNVLGGENPTIFEIFRTLHDWHALGILTDVNFTFRKHTPTETDLLAFDWLSDGERMFLSRVTLFYFPEAGEWLWGKYGVIRPHLLQLVKRPLAEKQDILSAIDADLDLDACFNGGCFHAPDILKTSPAALNGEVKALFLAFYEFLNERGGVPGDKIGEHTDLTRQTVLQAYLTAQRGYLSVCPGCDGPPPSVADGKIHADLDHFFPKAKYPVLTVHPLNLTPLCKDCNQSYKHDKDALDDSEPLVSAITSLNEIYHPYMRTARDEIEVSVERDAAGQEKFKLRPRQVTPIYQNRLNSLLYTLNIEARWTGDLQEERVQADLETLLLYDTQDESPLIFDLPWLITQLRAAQFSFQRACGKKNGYVAAEAYTSFVLSDAPAQAQWLSLMQQARP